MTDAAARAELAALPKQPKPTPDEKARDRRIAADAVRQRDARNQADRYVLVAFDRAAQAVYLCDRDYPTAIRRVGLLDDSCDCKDGQGLAKRMGIADKHCLIVALKMEHDPGCIDRLPEPRDTASDVRAYIYSDPEPVSDDDSDPREDDPETWGDVSGARMSDEQREADFGV